MSSLWKNTEKLPHFPSLTGDRKTEVLNIGGGLAGILCAHKLAREGVPYILVEASRICSGITGNTTAKITSQHGLLYADLIDAFGLSHAKQYADAQQRAIEQYAKLIADEQIDCSFERKTSYL